MPKPLFTIPIIIRIYDEFLVLFRTNYINALDWSFPLSKGFRIRHLPISISFIFKDAGYHYPISRYSGDIQLVFSTDYSTGFVKESNIKRLFLNLHNNFYRDSALVLSNNDLLCLLFFILLLLKHSVSKIIKYRGVWIFLFISSHG